MDASLMRVAVSSTVSELPASAARPWRATQDKTVARGGPRQSARRRLLGAGVRSGRMSLLLTESRLP